MVDVHLVATCYRGGLLGLLLVMLVGNAGYGFWIGYMFHANVTGKLVYAIGTFAGMLTYAMLHVLGYFYEPKSSVYTVVCLGDYHGFYPQPVITMLYTYWMLSLSQELLSDHRIGWFDALRKLAWLVSGPAIMVWANNGILTNVLYGVLMGSLLGALWGCMLAMVIEPRMEAVAAEMALVGFGDLHHGDKSLM